MGHPRLHPRYLIATRWSNLLVGLAVRRAAGPITAQNLKKLADLKPKTLAIIRALSNASY